MFRSYGGKSRFASAALLALCAAAIGLAFAQRSYARDEDDRRSREIAAIREAVDRGQLLPLPRIMALALARVPGDIVRTELELHDKRVIYEVKVLTGTGRVREVELDARTGAVLSVEDD